jgi:hypothetical protein
MDAKSKEILMHGYMNDEALKKQSKLKKFIIGADLEKKFGTRVRQVDLNKK